MNSRNCECVVSLKIQATDSVAAGFGHKCRRGKKPEGNSQHLSHSGDGSDEKQNVVTKDLHPRQKE